MMEAQQPAASTAPTHAILIDGCMQMTDGAHDFSLLRYALGQIEEYNQREKQRLLESAKNADLPWPKNLIKEIAFKVSPVDIEILQEHRGFILQERIDAVNKARQVFNRAVDDLLAIREQMAAADAAGRLSDRSVGDHLEAINISAQKEMFAAASAAHSLVEHSRRLNKALHVEGYKERISYIAEDPQHNFMMCMRNNIHHFFVVDAGYQLITKWTDEGKKHSYSAIIHKHQLKRIESINRDKWNAAARQYIEKQDKTIDLLSLFQTYRHKINDIHMWWKEEIEKNAPEELIDFRNVTWLLERIRKIVLLKVILENLVTKNVNPYEYWAEYLTETELRELEKCRRTQRCRLSA